MRKLISLISAILFAFTAPAVLATGGHNPPPKPDPKPTPPPTQTVDIEQRVNVGVGVNTHTSSDAKASAGATSGSHSSAAGGNASASGGHSAATVGNVTGGTSSASTGPVTATGGQGGAGGSSSSSSSAAGGAGGSVGNIDAGSGNGNTVNIGGDTISYPRQNPGAIATTPAATTCVGAGTSVALSTPVVSFAINTASDRERCNAIVEAERCIAQAVFIRNSTGICKAVARPLGACFANMPPVQDAAKSLGLEPRVFADEMAKEVLDECNVSDKLAKQRADAEKAASANALAEAKARADQLAVELSAAREANSRINKILENERARKPLVVTRPAAKPPLTSGQVELELRLKSTCKTDCPPQQPQK